MLLHKSAVHDARVRREAGALAEAGHEVTVVHLPSETSANAEAPYALVSATLRRGRDRLPHPVKLATEATRLASRAAGLRPDAVHAHDAAMLLPGLAAARAAGARLVYDAHELATGVPYRSAAWARLVALCERAGVPRADVVITVSDGIAERLGQRYRLRRDPVVVRNVPDLPGAGAGAARGPGAVPDLREKLGIGGAPLILHQGAAAAGRGCETLIRAVARLHSAHLMFLGAEDGDAERLAAVAREAGASARTHFMAPAPLESLLSHTAQADVGVSLLEDSCDNHRLALPNKLFEYVAAGVPVVVSELPEMAGLVREHGIGWSADPADPDSVAEALSAALEHGGEDGLRQRLAVAAAELSWTREKGRLLALYEELAG